MLGTSPAIPLQQHQLPAFGLAGVAHEGKLHLPSLQPHNGDVSVY
jgi:hypothetical protein